jgi:photosystem II stability/assembly factor-like uncharacterized protein
MRLILLIALAASCRFHALWAQAPGSPDPGGVLNQLTVASFAGSGRTSIQAIATDANANVYVAGSTSSPDLPVMNAAQPQMGESRIMRSLDQGATWTQLANPPADPQIVEADPYSPLILFTGGFDGIHKSTDGGQTWRTVYALQSSSHGVTGLVIDPGNPSRVVALVSGIILSSDGGETWTDGFNCPESPCGSGLARIFVDPSGSGTMILVSIPGMYISRDGGLTFSALRPPALFANTAAFDPQHPGWIYVATATGTLGSLFLSMDGGATWTEKTNTPLAIQYLLVDPDQPNSLYAATLSGLYQSVDGATTWTRSRPPGSEDVDSRQRLAILSRECGPGGGLLAISGASHVLGSPDFGVTWEAPRLGSAVDVTTGPGCAVYAAKRIASDAFIAKLAPDGSQIWATFLGGSDLDRAVALALDAQSNVYVAGNTSSIDFPATLPPIGQGGLGTSFLARLDTDGNLIYAVVLDGAGLNSASGLAVDSQGNAYLVGQTSSASFPTTPGAFDTQFGGNGNGFIAKFGPDGALLYASYLGGSPTAVAVDSTGQALAVGRGVVPGSLPPAGQEPGYLIRLDPTGSQLTYAAYIGGTAQRVSGVFGPNAIAIDGQGNVFVTGNTAAPDFPITSGAYVSPLRSVTCSNPNDHLSPPISPGDIYVMKLRVDDFQPAYAALVGGECGSQPGALQIDGNGAATFSLVGYLSFPLQNPLLAAPSCNYFGFSYSGAISQLSADGSSLLFSTYLDTCLSPVVAVAPDGSLYAGVTNGLLAGILHFYPQ